MRKQLAGIGCKVRGISVNIAYILANIANSACGFLLTFHVPKYCRIYYAIMQLYIYIRGSAEQSYVGNFGSVGLCSFGVVGVIDSISC